jgi:hypothetical protein
MTKADKIKRQDIRREQALEVLVRGLKESDRIWNERGKEDNFAYLVGYLQGTIKLAIKELGDE